MSLFLIHEAACGEWVAIFGALLHTLGQGPRFLPCMVLIYMVPPHSSTSVCLSGKGKEENTECNFLLSKCSNVKPITVAHIPLVKT